MKAWSIIYTFPGRVGLHEDKVLRNALPFVRIHVSHEFGIRRVYRADDPPTQKTELILRESFGIHVG